MQTILKRQNSVQNTEFLSFFLVRKGVVQLKVIVVPRVQTLFAS